MKDLNLEDDQKLNDLSIPLAQIGDWEAMSPEARVAEFDRVNHAEYAVRDGLEWRFPTGVTREATATAKDTYLPFLNLESADDRHKAIRGRIKYWRLVQEAITVEFNKWKSTQMDPELPIDEEKIAEFRSQKRLAIAKEQEAHDELLEHPQEKKRLERLKEIRHRETARNARHHELSKIII